MIPKIIHYCWFGGTPLPKSAIRCIESWKKFFPDYEIKEWNEDNFDVYEIPYTSQAYKAGKYAFVSDYARFKILYEVGGIYFDTDVEIIKPFDKIVEKGPFMGMESVSPLWVNPGLGMSSLPRNPLVLQILNIYKNLNFITPEGSYNSYAVVKITTDVLINKGLLENKEVQCVDSFIIYPPSYFNPLEDITGKLRITEKTHSIHWYSKSWTNSSLKYIRYSRLIHRILGVKNCNRLKSLLYR